MLVVAVAALDQALQYAMAEWHTKFGLLLQVAGKAQFRLRFDQQVFFCCGVVRRVAVDAAYLVLPVERIRAIEVSCPGSMARQAAVIDFLG